MEAQGTPVLEDEVGEALKSVKDWLDVVERFGDTTFPPVEEIQILHDFIRSQRKYMRRKFGFNQLGALLLRNGANRS